MLTIIPDSSIQEIIPRGWVDDDCDSNQSEESSWDILDEDSSHDAVNRHWFKQNYVNQVPRNHTPIIYQ